MTEDQGTQVLAQLTQLGVRVDALGSLLTDVKALLGALAILLVVLVFFAAYRRQ